MQTAASLQEPERKREAQVVISSVAQDAQQDSCSIVVNIQEVPIAKSNATVQAQVQIRGHLHWTGICALCNARIMQAGISRERNPKPFHRAINK